MARYLPNAAFIILACVETGLLAAGDSLPHWDQIGWVAMAGAQGILATVWMVKGRG